MGVLIPELRYIPPLNSEERGGNMASMNVVNLDGLIEREDLAVPAEGDYGDIPGLKVTDLGPGVTFSLLRKPDFQRETANWSPQQVVGLIETFVNRNIIPAIILWQNGSRVFVVDGAHRLSALVAWVHDDYGAGKLSVDHYKGIIPDAQRSVHEFTKNLVKARVGDYLEYMTASQYPQGARPEVLARAGSGLWIKNIDVQWIRNANLQQARDSFFRINQGGTPIDPTETKILRAANSAIAISARAVSRGGTGHAYWKRFDEETQKAIRDIGADASKLLFNPPLKVPIKTLDVPISGFGYGSHVLPFVFDLIALANNLTTAESGRQPQSPDRPVEKDDETGEDTVKYLGRVRKLIRLVCSNDPSSLGLHPALYFYSQAGLFQETAFFNTVSWVMGLERDGKLAVFRSVRSRFENLLLRHPGIARPAIRRLGSGPRSRGRTALLYTRVVELLLSGKGEEEVWNEVISMPEFLYLKEDEAAQNKAANEGTPGKSFGRAAKSAGFLTQALPTASKCPICGGLMHVNGMTVDHKEKRAAGGSSAAANARMVHPRCGSERDVSE